MNKKLIALAVAAGMAAPMAAQADATWYGQLQAEIASHSSDFTDNGIDVLDVSGDGDATDDPLFDNHIWQNTGRWNNDGTHVEDDKRGRLGVKGSEELGGGLSAIYKFEFQVDTTKADVDDGDRNAFVGLKGNFGAIKAGALKTPYKYFGGVKYDPFVTTSAEARRYGGMTSGAFGHNGFWERAVSYQNDFGGANLWVTYNLDERNNTDGDYSLGLKFGGSNFEAFVATAHDADQDNDATTDDTSYDAMKVGGQFKSGPHKLSGQYEMTTQEAAGGDVDGTVLYVNYDMKMGKNIFTATYGMSELDMGGNDPEGTFMRVGMTHKFTKSTRAMLVYSNSNVDMGGQDADKSALVGAMRVDF